MAKKNNYKIIPIEFNGDKWEICYYKMSEMRGIKIVLYKIRNNPKWYQLENELIDCGYYLSDFDEHKLYETAAKMIARYYTNKEENEKVDKFFNEFFKED